MFQRLKNSNGLTILACVLSSFATVATRPARADYRAGMGDELPFIASDQGQCTGYVINSAPKGKTCPKQDMRALMTAAHCSAVTKTGGRDWHHTSDSMTVVTGSSAGHPLDIVTKMAASVGTSAAGAGGVAMQVGGHIVGLVKGTSEVAVRTGKERDLDKEVNLAGDQQSTGLEGAVSRLSAARPFVGTYHKFPTTGFQTNVCHDTMAADVSRYFKNREDVKTFEVASQLPKRGEKLRAMGYAEGPGRADLSGCRYEGVQVAPKSDMRGEKFEVDQLLHKVVCPEGVDPRGMSGGPILNASGEVVGTIVRGGQYPKGKHAKNDKLFSTSVCDYEGCTRKEDTETVLLFSALTQDNLSCEGVSARSPAGESKVANFLNGNRIDSARAKFDEKGCLNEVQATSSLPSGETFVADTEHFNSTATVAKADECLERFLGICVQYTAEATARYQEQSTVQSSGMSQ